MSRWSRRQWLAAVGLTPLAACGDRREASASGGLRVASQTVLSDEVLWDLGPAAQAQVVAVSSMADDKRYSRVVEKWPAAIPRAAGSSESLLALVPDLVILASFTAAETLRLIEKANLKTLIIEHFDGFDDYRHNVQAIADAIGQSDAGTALVATFDARLASLRRTGSSGPRVLSWNEGSVPAAKTSFHDAAIAAGLRHLPAELGKTGHLQVSVEQLVAWDPDLIVVPCGETQCEKAVADIKSRPGIRSTRAAQDGGIVGVPSRDLYSVGAGMLDVVERLASHAHGATP